VTRMKQLRIALLGAPAAGKTTSAELLVNLCNEYALEARIEKLAKPLYDLQRAVYQRIGRSLAGQDIQDPELLVALAAHLRRIDEKFLIRDFLNRVGMHADVIVVINDDVREFVDCINMMNHGFEFWLVQAPVGLRMDRLSRRSDLSAADEVRESQWALERKELAVVEIIDNDNDIETLRMRLRNRLTIKLGKEGLGNRDSYCC
jgi:dephospho-CoA kinase